MVDSVSIPAFFTDHSNNSFCHTNVIAIHSPNVTNGNLNS